MIAPRPPAPAPRDDEAAARALEAAISARARDFELPALLDLLRRRFPRRAVRFGSRPSLSHRAALIDAVAFAPDHVLVTLNLGLFSATTPLPAYFHELLQHPKAGPALEALLAVLDEGLLRDRADALQPIAADRLLPGAPEMRSDALALARPGSPITLHWLFARVYPELGVTVRRAPQRRALPIEDPCLGRARIGYAALGGEAEVATPGYDVILCTEESTTWDGAPWIEVARRRLPEDVFPALAGAGAHLCVYLVDREGRGRLELQPRSFLGFDPLESPRPPKVAILFEGQVG